MAKRRRQKKKESWWGSALNPEIKRGVVAVFLFILAILAGLSFFGLAGLLGQFINDLFSILFGVAKYAMPILLVIWAILIEREDEYEYRPTHVIGVILTALCVTSLIHLFLGGEDKIATALIGQGGGLFGLALSYPLGMAFDFWVTLVILVALLMMALLFLFNTSLTAIFDTQLWFIEIIKRIGSWFVRLIGIIFRIDRLRVFGAYEDGDDESGFSQKRLGENNEMEDAFEDEEDYDEDDEEDDSESGRKKTPRKNPFKLTSIKGLPPLDLLSSNSSKPTSGDIKSNAQVIKETLDHFGIEIDLGDVRVGPTVTQYTIKPLRGTKLSRITGLSNDLALELAAHPIRIEAPIPGKSLVGIEVPNQKIAMVTLKELLSAPPFKEREHNMMVALGKDVAGHVWFADLPKMPHMLVAGATGSGKTVCLNTIILSLLYQNTPDMLRFIFVDPKRVELTMYNGIPHLLTPVITDVKKTVNALRWTINEMERRFDLLSKCKKRDIGSYNKTAKEKMPYIVFVVDELADLMATNARDVEAGIVRLAQMARAVGIHLILATQRPSVDVITGLIKANIPARVAFSVASITDSRTILDCAGADKLLGRGDMLFLSPSLSKPKRLQGAFVSDHELKGVSRFLKDDYVPEYDDSIVEKGGGSSAGSASVFGGGDDHDDLFEEARDLIIEAGKASASFLQRRLRVGYARAARILDELEEAGIVGPARGAKPREILITEKVIAEEDIVEVEEVDGEEEYEEEDEGDDMGEKYEEDEEEDEEDKL